jgi:hypothetical protein
MSGNSYAGFTIGDVVTQVRASGGESRPELYGVNGTVVCFDLTSSIHPLVGVEFDKKVHAGHTLGGLLRLGGGRWYGTEELMHTKELTPLDIKEYNDIWE